VVESLPECLLSTRESLAAAATGRPGRDSEDYLPPDRATLTALAASIDAAAAGRYRDALAAARDAGYDLCAVGPVVIWTSDTSGLGRAVVALRIGDTSGLVLEAPHGMFDLGTRDQAVELFLNLSARGVITAGTHRCANSAASACDGRTSVCSGESAPYPESDMAHNLETTFHAAHVALAESFPDAVFVSLHGSSLPGVSVSNGTTGPVDADDPAPALAAAFSAELPGEEVTSCNEFPGALEAGVGIEQRLCGTTNVQGRHLNGSPDACGTAATDASGRFIHLEQSRDVRNDIGAVRATLRAAL
jgi:hypothetical protein